MTIKRNQRFLLMVLVVISCLGCDQFSKKIAKQTLSNSPPKSYFGETFRLQYAENTGAFLSLGAGLSKTTRTWLFTIISGGLLVVLFFYIIFSRQLNGKNTVAFSLILGGGGSNILDRLLNDGRVIDFMNIGIGSLRTGIFNIADVVIMLGMGLIILLNIRDKKANSESKPEGDADEVAVPSE